MQKLVDNMVNIDDREKRTRYAHILVELMRQIHPNMKDGQDYYNKLWDDLYIMSNFTLDVESPYPPPSEEALGKKPQRVPYNTHPLKYKHFGRNIDLLIAKAVSLDDLDEKRAFVSYLTRLMKTFYSAWNKESVEDETIFQSLLDISKGKLADEITYIRENGLVDATPRERTGDQTQPQRISGVIPMVRDNAKAGRADRESTTGTMDRDSETTTPGGKIMDPAIIGTITDRGLVRATTAIRTSGLTITTAMAVTTDRDSAASGVMAIQTNAPVIATGATAGRDRAIIMVAQMVLRPTGTTTTAVAGNTRL